MPKRLLPIPLSALACVWLLVGCATPPAGPPEGDPAATPSVDLQRVEGVPHAPLVLALFKQKRELVVVRDGRPDQTFRVRLGPAPRGHKAAMGDMRTPEGTYTICEIRPSRFRTFMWLSYPNEQDAQRALEQKRLSRAQYERIVGALSADRCPPPNTPLGGLVGIHGDYQDPPRHYDWTEGCIALAHNEDLSRLTRLVRAGTPVVIFP